MYDNRIATRSRDTRSARTLLWFRPTVCLNAYFRAAVLCSEFTHIFQMYSRKVIPVIAEKMPSPIVKRQKKANVSEMDEKDALLNASETGVKDVQAVDGALAGRSAEVIRRPRTSRRWELMP